MTAGMLLLEFMALVAGLCVIGLILLEDRRR
jgi:hypothetical protein